MIFGCTPIYGTPQLTSFNRVLFLQRPQTKSALQAPNLRRRCSTQLAAGGSCGASEVAWRFLHLGVKKPATKYGQYMVNICLLMVNVWLMYG